MTDGTKTYQIRAPGRPWETVPLSRYVMEERRSGFVRRDGGDGPATGGFRGMFVEGRIIIGATDLPEVDHLEEDLFAFLGRKYVVTADDRQKAMGLDYLTTERRDLAKEVTRFIRYRERLAANMEGNTQC